MATATGTFPYTVQFASRLFLNDISTGYFSPPWNKLIRPVNNARLLLLLGDIGFRQARHTHEFIQYCSINWERTLWIEGKLERERNPDGNPPRMLPGNVEYINYSKLIHLTESSSANKSIYLYASPLRSYSDLKYLKKESAKEGPYLNYLLVATYCSRPYSLDFYPANCLGWFQGYYQNNNYPCVNMFYNQQKKLDIDYNPTKFISV